MSGDYTRCMIGRVMGSKCAVAVGGSPRDNNEMRTRDERGLLISGGYLHHDAERGFYELTPAGRELMGYPQLHHQSVYDPNVIPELERAMASAIMGRRPCRLRARIEALGELDRRLRATCEHPFVLYEPVEPLLAAGAFPDGQTCCAAIANMHYGALVEFRRIAMVPAVQDVQVALRKCSGQSGWPDIMEALIDWGLQPAPWMAAMARDAHCPECLGMLRERGLTEEQMIEGVCGRE